MKMCQRAAMDLDAANARCVHAQSRVSVAVDYWAERATIG